MTDVPAVATEHPAPPPYRPLSGGAVTALVLALVLAIFAIGGPWWIEVIPLAIAALSWGAISDGRRRGAGIAIAACVIALVVGGFAFFTLKDMTSALEDGFDKLLTALEKDDRKELSGWVVTGEEVAPRIAAWHERYAAVKAQVGPYAGSARVRSGLWGPGFGLLVPTSDDLDEIVPAGAAAEKRPGPAEAVWFQAGFARAKIWVALVLGREGGKLVDFKEATKFAESSHPSPILREIRFFRAAVEKD